MKKIQNKFIFILISIGLVTIVTVGITSFSITKSSLESEIAEKLKGITETKSQQVEDYFTTINKQLLTFSQSQTVVEAMEKFKESFHTIDVANLDSSQKSLSKNRLEKFYSQDFLPQLQKRLPNAQLNQYFPESEHTQILQDILISANPHPTGSKNELSDLKDSKLPILSKEKYNEFHKKYHPIIAAYLAEFEYYDIFLVDHKTGHIVYSVFKELDFATSLIDGPYNGLSRNYSEYSKKGWN